jgi:hypothetical protein
MVVDVVTWKLITPKKEFDFVCASAEEKDDWFRCIRYTMEGTIPPVFVDVRHAVSLCYIAVLIDDDMCTFLSLSLICGMCRGFGRLLHRCFPTSWPSTKSSVLASRQLLRSATTMQPFATGCRS